MEDYGKLLYDKLPQLYRTEDSKINPSPYPLKRFLEIAGVGFDYLAEKQEGHANMYDLYKTPNELLPYLGEMMGYKFPYEMSDIEQRNFLKVLPLLYKFKGTERVFDYLAQVVYGPQTRVNSEYRLNVDPINPYKHVIDIYIEVNGSFNDVIVRAERFHKFANNFRPINTVVNPVIQMFYADEYIRPTNTDIIASTLMRTITVEDYDKGRITERENILLLNFNEESYNVGNMDDSITIDVLVTKPTVETYDINPTDNSSEDYSISMGAVLNASKLNERFVLNTGSIITKLN